MDYQEHPLYRALYDYADELFEVLDNECCVDAVWPNAQDLDELERHLLDAVSQLGISLNLASESINCNVIEQFGLAFNNLRIANNLLRNILLSSAFENDEKSLRAQLHAFLKRAAQLEQILLKNLTELSTNFKLR